MYKHLHLRPLYVEDTTGIFLSFLFSPQMKQCKATEWYGVEVQKGQNKKTKQENSIHVYNSSLFIHPRDPGADWLIKPSSTFQPHNAYIISSQVFVAHL